ncbi:hypothetical protein [Methylocystis parvus]|uniref:hypothetical protein n=1 Tax=Methylocystis parvus TaxID=134 RepID=UPI003C76C887
MKSRSSPAIADFYLTNPVARASAVMAECSRSRLRKASNSKRRSRDVCSNRCRHL